MKVRHSISIVFLALLANLALATDWRSSYEDGLKAAHAGRWQEARGCFKQAAGFRHKDFDRATVSPAPWRNGASYSPNFLAAYCEYRIAVDCRDAAEQKKDFVIAQGEFERLVSSGQRSRDTYFYLDIIYTRFNDHDRKAKLAKDFRGQRFAWKVDEDCLPPEELNAIQFSVGNLATSRTILAADLDPEDPTAELVPGGASGPNDYVPHDPKKFAFVVGEDSPVLGSLTCSSYDAKLIRDGLVQYAGYDPANVVLLQNVPAASIMEQAKSLAARVGQDAVVLVFYAGAGSSVQGKDYLGGSDSSSRFDTETMASKAAIYQAFLDRGAKIFSFYEVNRPIENGFFFGSEVPQVGSVSQMEATIPDSEVTTTVANGHPTGLYASAFFEVLSELKSNRLPIYEFGWQIYNKMKRGHQIPTLPVLNNLAADSRF